MADQYSKTDYAVMGAGAAGSLLQLFGYISSGRMARIEGERAKVAAEFAAVQADKAAGEVMAISQRQAMEEQRKGRYEASRALAVAAANGGASDPTVINLLANTKGEATYRASVALYEGESRARKLRLEAVSRRLSGQSLYDAGVNTDNQYELAGLGSLAKGGASLYAKYGMGRSGSGDSALISTTPAANRM